MKKARRETQTLRAGCSKAEPKKFCPAADPFPVAQDGQNLISWRRSLPLPATQFGEDRCTQFRVIVVTDTQTHPQTHTQTRRQDRLQYTASQLASPQCKNPNIPHGNIPGPRNWNERPSRAYPRHRG